MCQHTAEKLQIPCRKGLREGLGSNHAGSLRDPLNGGGWGAAAPEARHALEHASTGRRGGAKNRPIQPALAGALVATARAISTAGARRAAPRGAGSGSSTSISRPCGRSRESHEGVDAAVSLLKPCPRQHRVEGEGGVDYSDRRPRGRGQGLPAAGPGALKKLFFIIARSAKLTTWSPFRSAFSSALKNTLFIFARSPKFTMPSLVRSASQAVP